MSEDHGHHGTMYECMDKDAESIPGSAANTDGVLTLRPAAMAWLAHPTIFRKNSAALCAQSELAALCSVTTTSSNTILHSTTCGVYDAMLTEIADS